MKMTRMKSTRNSLLLMDSSGAGIGSSIDLEQSHVGLDYDEEHNHHEEEMAVLARDETRAVWCLKIVVIVILLGATVGISSWTYVYTSGSEQKAFTDTFEEYAQQIQSTVDKYAQQKIEAMASLALQIQMYVLNSNETWPFVTIPYFEQVILTSQSLTDAKGIMLFPIVSVENRVEWEKYSIAHKQWIWDSYEYQRKVFGSDLSEVTLEQLNDESFDWFDFLWGDDFINPSNPDLSNGIPDTIMTTEHEDPDVYDPVYDYTNGPYYFPQWQTAPLSKYYQTSINSNYGHFSDFNRSTQIVQETGYVVYGEAWTDFRFDGRISTVLYPIFDTMDTTTTTTGSNTTTTDSDNNSTVVAFLALDIFWQMFLEEILPPNSDGIYVVIESTCDQIFTYQLFGEKAVWVDDGDHHETKFDHLKHFTWFGRPLMAPNGDGQVSEPSYTGRPLYHDFCNYYFYVYPSQQMQDRYTTKKPIVYTVTACLIFLFTSLVFVTYDWIVERRQHIVMTSATRADKIVSSLFPSDVKGKLYETADNYKSNRNSNNNEQQPQPTEFMGIKSPNANWSTATATTTTNSNSVNMEVSPIADLYPNTTILFADIAGFTAFSNGRQPKDVFHLLESIYAMFDKAAKRRGVFKVETIGDCYVAVTGLPRPRDDHAVAMVRFTYECLSRLPTVLDDLVERLGPETKNLAMRAGLHSGPVTAGVLRGEKARFQLFGDTVNTASRMESNGERGRIHISKDTAKLLIAANKGHWIVPRKDKIVAKGKGEMDTFWVLVKGVAASATDETTEKTNDDMVGKAPLQHSPMNKVDENSESESPMKGGDGELLDVMENKHLPGTKGMDPVSSSSIDDKFNESMTNRKKVYEKLDSMLSDFTSNPEDSDDNTSTSSSSSNDDKIDKSMTNQKKVPEKIDSFVLDLAAGPNNKDGDDTNMS